MTPEQLEELQGQYRRVLVDNKNSATPDDKFNVLVDLCDRYDYFFSAPDTVSEAELRTANAERKVVAWIIQQSHQSGSDLLSRLFEAVVARRIANP